MMITQLINKQGNAVANQFIITEGNKVSFQSYNSIICEIEGTWITFHKNYAYSNTTSKHRNKFLSDMLGCDITNKDVDIMIKEKSFHNFNVILTNE